jgi:hypothetical protein
MDNKGFDNSIANHWNNNPNWATDEEWVRAAANLEAETGVDILIGADLGNNLDFPDWIIPNQIDVDRLTVVIQEGLKDLLSQEELATLVAETNTYIGERVYHLKLVGVRAASASAEAFSRNETLRERNENRPQV